MAETIDVQIRVHYYLFMIQSSYFRQFRQFLRIISTLALASALSVALAPAAAAKTARTLALPGCPWGPNLYAGGIDTVGNRWGAQGYIVSYPIAVPKNSYNFSDQALWVTTSANGLEVGWYVGYGNQTGTYVTYPHAYTTADGPNEIDGPYLGATTVTGYYRTYWTSAGNEQAVVTWGTNSWATLDTVGNLGPGQLSNGGETDNSALPMKGDFSSMQHMWSNGTWYNWSGTAACQDSPYVVTAYTATSLSDR